MCFRKKINGFLIIIMIALLTACGGAEERKTKYLSKGQEYFDQGNYDKARIELKNVLQIDPKHAKAYYLLGEVFEKDKDWRKAFANYLKSLELDRSNVKVTSKLAKFYLLQGDINKAREMADLSLKNDPNSQDAKLAHVIVLVRENHISEAKKIAYSMISDAPKNIDIYDFLSSLLTSENKLDEAEKIIRTGIENNANDVVLRLKLAKLVFDKDKKEAGQLIGEIIQIDPLDEKAYALLAAVYVADNDPEKAENTLRALVKNNPDEINSYMLLIDFLSKVRGVSVAEKELNALIASRDDMPDLVFVLSKIYLAQGKIDETKSLYEKLISEHGTGQHGLKARNELATIYLETDQLVKAASLADEVLTVNVSDNTALMIKAEIAVKKKDPETAITALRTIIKEQPGSTKAAALIAQAHYMKGEKSLAREALEKTIEHNPKATEAHMALVQLYMLMGDVESALLKLEDVLLLDKGNKGALVLKIEIAMKKRDYDNAANTIQQLILSYPEDSLGYYVSGQYHLVNNDYKKAEAQFRKSLQFNKNAEKALSGLIKALLSQNKHNEALNYLNERRVENPDNAFLFNLIGETYASSKKHDDAERNFLSAIKISNKWSLPYGNLANLYISKNEPQKAISYLNTAIEYNEKDDKLLLLLASIHEQQGQYMLAKEQYEKILTIFPNHLLAINNLSSLLADRFDDSISLNQALELAEKLAKTNNAAYIDTLGWVYYKTGRLEEAEKLLKQVVSVAPQYPIFRYHLGMVYHKMGQHNEAKTHLEKAIDNNSTFPGKDVAVSTLNKIK